MAEIKQAKATKVAPKKRAKVERDYVVRIINNSSGIVCFNPKNGRTIELQHNGDSEYVTVAELQEIKNLARGLLSSYDLLPVEVIEGDCELSDVINFLGIQGYFENEIDEKYFDTLVLRSNLEDFENVVKSSHQGFKDQIVKRAISLFKEGRFTFYPKMDFLKELTGNDMLFEK